MNCRTNILARLRRSRSGAARYVVGLVAVAYLSAGVAPCVMAAADQVKAAPREHVSTEHEGHAQHGRRDLAAHSQHGEHAQRDGSAPHERVPAAGESSGEFCPHCSHGTPIALHDAHSSCFAFEDLTNVAASHAKDAAQQPLAPLLAPAAFTLPPPLASPGAPSLERAAPVAPVALNVRHCVFLI